MTSITILESDLYVISDSKKKLNLDEEQGDKKKCMTPSVEYTTVVKKN